MKLGFILTTYDRIDDMLSHLEILKYFPKPCEIIPIWMRKDMPSHFLKEMEKYPNAHYYDGVRFNIGPLLGLVSGIRKAHELGCEYIVYRNGDDWLFNHDFVLNNLRIMDSGKDIAAYNWLSCDTYTEFALNEMYVRVSKFIKTMDEAEHYFRTSRNNFLCELKISRWIRKTLGSELEQRFYRLPDREFSPGVGYEPETLREVFNYMQMEMPTDFMNSIEDNHRFFNRKWQLIGSHNNLQRYSCYCKIRNDIPYHLGLEKEKNFARWIDSIASGTTWNLPITPRDADPKMLTYHRQKRILRFHKLPAVKVPKMLPRFPLLRRNK